MDQIFHKRQFPLPYNFINTMSNTASFYVAQSLQLESLNITFSSKQFSFERGLELLRCDLLAGAAGEGLIGGVDEACFSQAQFEAKYPLPSGSYARVEGSCWLLVSQNPAGAVGEIKAIESFPEMKALLSWLGRQAFGAPVKVGFGVLLTRTSKPRSAAHCRKRCITITFPNRAILIPQRPARSALSWSKARHRPWCTSTRMPMVNSWF